jgi:signal transduction histidine kinase
VSRDGIVLESNGWLDTELGTSVAGRPFTDLVDEGSVPAWEKCWASAREANAKTVCTPLLRNGAVTVGPIAVSVLWDAESGVAWLIEHPADARIRDMHEEVIVRTSELADTQRDLLVERARLARSLAATERSNRALDEFAHAISHDLKAPLRSVANYARWIEEDLGGALTGEPRAHMDLLRSQVERMRSMIDGVLEYSRSGRTRMEPEPVDTATVVAEVIALIDPPATCTIDVSPNLPVFNAERAPLRQVLLNLIDNAIKHSHRSDAHVWVNAVDAGSAYEFTVRDNGPGIAPRAQEKIWMLFHTLQPRKPAFSATEDGTGVGLAIVRQLVEVQGGRAWVESEEGKGATFHFFWPKRVQSPGGDSTAAASSV